MLIVRGDPSSPIAVLQFFKKPKIPFLHVPYRNRIVSDYGLEYGKYYDDKGT